MRSSQPLHAATGSPLDVLDDWVGAGLIAPGQADRIRAHEAARHDVRLRLTIASAPAGTSRSSLVVEALAYLGGIIMLTGAGILVGLFWGDIPVGLRLVLVAVTVLALAGAGLAVPDRLGEAAGRLRSVLWALSVAATGAWLAILSTGVLDRYDERSLIVVFPPAALLAGVLWWRHRTWLQQLVLLVTLAFSAVAVGTEVTSADTAPGLAMWLVAAAWTAVAWTGRLQPRVTGLAFGGLAVILAAMTTPSELGIVLSLVTATAVFALALYERSLPLLAVAAFGTLEAVSRAAVEWFPGRLSASLVLIAVGGLLVAAGVWVARHQATRQRPPA